MRLPTALCVAAGAWALWRSRPGERLDGSVALVTGGSRGLGYLIAEQLLAEGCRGSAERRGYELFSELPTRWLRQRLLTAGGRANQRVKGLAP